MHNITLNFDAQEAGVTSLTIDIEHDGAEISKEKLTTLITEKVTYQGNGSIIWCAGGLEYLVSDNEKIALEELKNLYIQTSNNKPTLKMPQQAVNNSEESKESDFSS
jgi:hypothetical protein